MHDGEAAHGLNTAATLWTTASMGLAAGGGYYAVTLMIFVAVLICSDHGEVSATPSVRVIAPDPTSEQRATQ